MSSFWYHVMQGLYLAFFLLYRDCFQFDSFSLVVLKIIFGDSAGQRPQYIIKIDTSLRWVCLQLLLVILFQEKQSKGKLQTLRRINFNFGSVTMDRSTLYDPPFAVQSPDLLEFIPVQEIKSGMISCWILFRISRLWD